MGLQHGSRSTQADRTRWLRHVVTLLLLGCSDPVLLGNCEVKVDDPLLAIASVVDASSGSAIGRVTLSLATFRGVQVLASDLPGLLWPTTNIAEGESGADILCDVPCGLVGRRAGTTSRFVRAATNHSS